MTKVFKHFCFSFIVMIFLSPQVWACTSCVTGIGEGVRVGRPPFFNLAWTPFIFLLPILSVYVALLVMELRFQKQTRTKESVQYSGTDTER